MSTDVRTTLASLDLLAWRDGQLAAISDQLEDAFADLRAQLEALVDGGGLRSLAASALRRDPQAAALLRDWSAEQSRIALARAEADLEAVIAARPVEGDEPEGAWRDVGGALVPAAAGVGLLAASLAAIPTVISFATVTTSTFALFATSTVSWPLFAVGATILATASFAGSTALSRAEAKARASLKAHLVRAAARDVLGLGLAPDARCLRNDLQALVVRAGHNRLQDAA